VRFHDSRLPALITEEDVAGLVAELPKRADCNIYETSLSQSVMGDETNKRVLQILAAQPDSLISTATLDASFTSQGIDTTVWQETLKGFLKLPGIFKINGEIRDIVQFSFIDPNFRRYIMMRESN
jgi:hypothetical protein